MRFTGKQALAQLPQLPAATDEGFRQGDAGQFLIAQQWGLRGLRGEIPIQQRAARIVTIEQRQTPLPPSQLGLTILRRIAPAT